MLNIFNEYKYSAQKRHIKIKRFYHVNKIQIQSLFSNFCKFLQLSVFALHNKNKILNSNLR